MPRIVRAARNRRQSIQRRPSPSPPPAVRASSLMNEPTIQTFRGIGDKIPIENWLSRFNDISEFYTWNERKKIVMLGNFLVDEALSWYTEEKNDCDWQQLEEKLISRFGVSTTYPIVEFVHLKYDFNSDMKTYFEKKRRLGHLAKLTEEQMIPLLIDGLPASMANSFVALRPKNLAHFYEVASNAEANVKKNSQKPFFKGPNERKSFDKDRKEKKKPPHPCKICDELGFKNRYHWMPDCINKDKKKAKQINSMTCNCNAEKELDNFRQLPLN